MNLFSQVHTFYEAVGCMISAQVDQAAKDILIEKYMALPNQVWDDIISQASQNVDHLKGMAAVKQLGSILRTNVRACKALGHSFVLQLGRIYLDMLNVYKIMSENIIQAITVNGIAVNNQPLIKAMHVVKKETLILISEWVVRSNDNNVVIDSFIPPLLDAILLDYQRCKVPEARESKVLSTMAAIVGKLKVSITSEIPQIFDAVFECTLDMIKKNFEDFPQHRVAFYELLQQVNAHCFDAFLNIPPPQFKLVFDSIVWAFKHTMRNVADMGLQILYVVSLHPFYLRNSSIRTSFFENVNSMYFVCFIETDADKSRTGLTVSSTKLLSNILHRHSDTDLLGGHRYIAHSRPTAARPDSGVHVHAGRNPQSHRQPRTHPRQHTLRTGICCVTAEDRI